MDTSFYLKAIYDSHVFAAESQDMLHEYMYCKTHLLATPGGHFKPHAINYTKFKRALKHQKQVMMKTHANSGRESSVHFNLSTVTLHVELIKIW